MVEKKLVSVIIPAFNVGGYIEKCVHSVIFQEYKNIEVIIIDDGSEDNTLAVCKKISNEDKRIKVISQQNKGVVVARQVGVENASGDYVIFIDGDDWIESSMIAHMVEHMNDADMISVGTIFDGENSSFEMLDRYKEGEYFGGKLEKILETMIYNNEDHFLHPLRSSIWAKMYRRDLTIRVHGLIDSKLKFAEDGAFLYLYMLECKKIVVSHKCFYHYVQRRGSLMNTRGSFFLQYIQDAYHFMYAFFEKIDKYDLKFQLQEWLVNNLIISINERMDFDERCYIPEYVFDTDGLDGYSIILYGAGRVGKNFYYLRKKIGINIVAWVDRNAENLCKQGLQVCGLELGLQCEFDYIYIAIENRKIAMEVKKQLEGMGIPKEKIIWRKPYKFVI